MFREGNRKNADHEPDGRAAEQRRDQRARQLLRRAVGGAGGQAARRRRGSGRRAAWPRSSAACTATAPSSRASSTSRASPGNRPTTCARSSRLQGRHPLRHGRQHDRGRAGADAGRHRDARELPQHAALSARLASVQLDLAERYLRERSGHLRVRASGSGQSAVHRRFAPYWRSSPRRKSRGSRSCRRRWRTSTRSVFTAFRTTIAHARLRRRSRHRPRVLLSPREAKSSHALAQATSCAYREAGRHRAGRRPAGRAGDASGKPNDAGGGRRR